MAITISEQPDKFAPVYNEMAYVVTSTNRTQDNFKYIADIYPTGATSPTYYRLKLSPDPTYGSVAFDIHEVLESFATKDFSAITAFTRNTSSYISYTVKFGEEYGPSSGTTVYADLTTTSTKYAYNGIFDFEDFYNYTEADWLITTGTTKYFLTNQPSSVKVRSEQNAYLYMMTDTANAVHRMQIKTYDSSGTLIATHKVNNDYAAIPTEGSRFLRFPAGPKNINLIDASDFDSGGQTVITGSVASYTLQTIDASGTGTSEIQTYTVDDTCTKYDVYQFHFKNKIGGYDQCSFIRLSRHNVEIERSKFKKPISSLLTSADWGYNLNTRGDVQYNTNIKDKITVHSDWVSEDEATWLEELITSPDVYYDDGTNFFAVNITNTTYERKKTVNDKLINITIEFEYSYNRYRQRG